MAPFSLPDACTLPVIVYKSVTVPPAASGQRLRLRRHRPAGIAGVDDATRLDEEHRGLDVGSRAVLGPAPHHEQLTRREADVTVAQLQDHRAVDDEEELIGVGVGVPGEVALYLHDLDVVV